MHCGAETGPRCRLGVYAWAPSAPGFRALASIGYRRRFIVTNPGSRGLEHSRSAQWHQAAQELRSSSLILDFAKRFESPVPAHPVAALPIGTLIDAATAIPGNRRCAGTSASSLTAMFASKPQSIDVNFSYFLRLYGDVCPVTPLGTSVPGLVRTCHPANASTVPGWGGGSPPTCAPRWCWMRSRWPVCPAVRTYPGCGAISMRERNFRLFAAVNAWPKSALFLRSVRSGSVLTMPWPKRSMDTTRVNSCRAPHARGRGSQSRTSSSRPSNPRNCSTSTDLCTCGSTYFEMWPCSECSQFATDDLAGRPRLSSVAATPRRSGAVAAADFGPRHTQPPKPKRRASARSFAPASAGNALSCLTWRDRSSVDKSVPKRLTVRRLILGVEHPSTLERPRARVADAQVSARVNDTVTFSVEGVGPNPLSGGPLIVRRVWRDDRVDQSKVKHAGVVPTDPLDAEPPSASTGLLRVFG